MQAIKITFLGTGTSQGVPVISCNCEVCCSKDKKDSRLRTSILVESKTTCFVIDTGPDFRQQCLKLDLKKLDAVLFTHEHKDHTAGLDDVRAFNYFQKRVMPIYSTNRVQTAIRREFAYAFEGLDYPGIPQIELIEFDNEPFYIGDILVEPINVLHYKLPVKAFKINNFVYITDANFIDEGEQKKIKYCDVLVLNALRHEPHISHFTLSEAIELSQKLKAKKTYFTHISHQLGTHASASKLLPQTIELACDGLQLII